VVKKKVGDLLNKDYIHEIEKFEINFLKYYGMALSIMSLEQ
jgi:hypothetical protein